MFQFGIGGMYGVPNGGNLATPTGPQRFGTIQDVSVEFDQKLVELMGQSKMPDDVAPSDMKITGKGGFGNIEIELYNALFFADTVTVGSNQVSQDEKYTIASSTNPAVWVTATLYTLGQVVYDGANIQICTVGGTSGGSAPSWSVIPGAVTADGSTLRWTCVGAPSNWIKVANAATFIENLNVRLYSGGSSLQPVATGVAPTTGQYTVQNGVYGFATADIGIGILISYEYATPAAAANQGSTLTVNNHLQGYGPTFELFLVMPYMGNNCLHLHKCRSSKMSAPMKRDGYVISDFEFQAYPDANGVAFDWYQLGS